MKNKIRFGVLGSGFMGRTHAEAMHRLGDAATLVGVWGGSRAGALAERYGAVCEKTMEALVRRPDIDAIVVATPHHLHAEEALLALDLGKHAMVEKPVTTTVEDCDRLLAAAGRTKAVLAIVYQQRFRMNNVRARELIQSGAIGRLLTVQISMPHHKATYETGGFGGNWDWENRPESVGFIINSAPHAIDLIRWFTGAEPRTVSAFSRSFIPGLTVEDTTMATIEYTDGTLFSLYSSYAFPATPFPNEEFRFRIMGTKGLLDLDPYGELRIEDGQGWRVASVQPAVGHTSVDTAFSDVRMQAYCDQMRAFIDGIHGQPLRCGSGRDGRVGIAACVAMLASSRERRWVELA